MCLVRGWFDFFCVFVLWMFVVEVVWNLLLGLMIWFMLLAYDCLNVWLVLFCLGDIVVRLNWFVFDGCYLHWVWVWILWVWVFRFLWLDVWWLFVTWFDWLLRVCFYFGGFVSGLTCVWELGWLNVGFVLVWICLRGCFSSLGMADLFV